MEITFNKTLQTDKEEEYKEFLKKAECLVAGETEAVSVMANMSAALKETFGFFWVGFYIVKGEELILGPFQGSVACYRIAKGRGVCGKAWERERTIIVEDVDSFPGHIACSSLSKSEIVVPILSDQEVVGVIDVDSDRLAAFDENDRWGLEKVATLIAKTLY